MAVTLTLNDLTPFAPTLTAEQAAAMIGDALALAARVAPCILTTTDESVIGAAKAILRGAVLRWHESGNAAYNQMQAGPFQVVTDNRQGRKSMFWPSEISDLQALCGTTARTAYMIDTLPPEDGS